VHAAGSAATLLNTYAEWIYSYAGRKYPTTQAGGALATEGTDVGTTDIQS
jgi:hypothetical protein